MKNQKTVIAKTNKVENLKDLNIDKISKEVIKEEKIKTDSSIYKKEFSLKSKRQSLRNKLKTYSDNIINYSDLQKDAIKLKETIKEFIEHYKIVYLKNDFKIESLRKKVNENEKKDLNRMLEIIKNNI